MLLRLRFFSLFALIFLSSISVYSQWNLVNTPASKRVLDLSFATETLAFACGDDIVMRSEDSGLTWDSVDIGLPPPSPTFSVRYIFSALATHESGQLTVLVSDSESGTEFIANSIDFGQNWTFDTTSISRLTDVYIVDETLSLATGRNNWLVSSDQGVSWEKNGPNVFGDFRKIDFLDTNSGLILSSQKLYLTNDKGQSWSPVELPASANYAQYINDSTLIIKVNLQDVYISRDTGATWEVWGANIPSIKNMRYVSFTHVDSAYFLSNGGGIQTFDGGQYLSRMVFNGVTYSFFYNLIVDQYSRGFILTGNGQIWRNDDLDAVVDPIATFSVNSPFPASCPGEVLTPNNNSDPAYQFFWTLNNDTISTEYQPDIVVPEGLERNFYIGLHALYQGGSVSSSRYIALEPKAALNPINDEDVFVGDTICIGRNYELSLRQPDDRSFTTYQLFQEGEQIDYKEGDFATLKSGPLTEQTQLELLVKDSSRCEVDSIRKQISVNVFAFNEMDLRLTDSSLCHGTPFSVRVENHQAGVSYFGSHNKKGTNGAKGNIDFGVFEFGQTGIPFYHIGGYQHVSDSWLNINRRKSLNRSMPNSQVCRRENLDSLIMNIKISYSDFQIDHSTIFKDEPLRLRNFARGETTWEYAPLPDSIQSKGKDYLIQYSQKGKVTIQQETQKLGLCKDSVSRDFYVVDEANTSLNSTSRVDTFSLGSDYSNYFMTDMEVDTLGNKYVTGYATYF
ncbi:MAG: hypothetical protein AAGC85_16330, partial [Bacteroidota bacterium]